MIILWILLHGKNNASVQDCSNKIGFQVIQSNLDMSNVTKISITINAFDEFNTDFTTTTFERATFTIEPYDGNEIVISSNPPNL